jgi:hypothetical protein
MLHLNRRASFAMFVVVALIGPQSSRATAGEVKDRAGFFTAAEVTKANDAIDAIKHLYKREVMISTFETVPPDRIDTVKKMDRERRNLFFAAWARERMTLEENKDIYILICKDPAHIQIELGQEILDKVITLDDQRKLKELLVKDFREKKYDQGLLHAVEFIRGKLDEHVFQLFPGPAANTVKDYGSFFSPASVESAAAQMEKISRQLKRPIAVDTFKQVPREKQAQAASREQRDRFFLDWIRNRMSASRFQGIYILVSKEPGHVEVGVSPELMKRAFKPSDRESLQKLLQVKFGDHRFDEGLTEALNLIQERVRVNLGTGSLSSPAAAAKSNVPAGNAEGAKTGESKKQDLTSSEPAKQAPATPSGIDQAKKKLSEAVTKGEEKVKKDWEAGPSWTWVLYLILGLLGLWIVIGIFRALFGSKKQPPGYYPPSQPPQSAERYSTGQGPQPVQPRGPAGYGAPQPMGPAGGYYQPPPPAGGGGGFMSGLLGGMFGAAAGNWIYDSFSGRSHMGGGGWGSSPAYGTPPYRPESSAGPADTGREISAGGGDFGEPAEASADAGGGDFGEPAEASADAGGGDFGEPADASADAGGGDFGETGGQEDSAGGGDFDAGGGDAGGGDSGGDAGGGDF